MLVNSNLWYVRWFKFNCKVMDKFTGKCALMESSRREHKFHDHASLCQFFRINVLGTLVQASSLATHMYAAGVFLVAPFVLFSFFQVVITVLVVLAAIAFLVGLACLGFLAGPISNFVTGTRNKMHNYLHSNDQSPGMINLIIHYILALKAKFCPTIHFTKDNNHD